jgi:hypothetical protein
MLLTDVDRRQLNEEAKVNPAFGQKLARMLDHPNGVWLIDESARRAVLNELDPKAYPESKGEWTVLRQRLNSIIRDLGKQINESVDNLSLDETSDMLMTYARGGIQVSAHPMGEYPVEALGQWEALVGAVVGAATSIYGAKLQSKTQRDIAKIQAAGAAKSLDAQMSLARAQMSLEAAKIKQIEDQTAAIKAGGEAPYYGPVSTPADAAPAGAASAGMTTRSPYGAYAGARPAAPGPSKAMKMTEDLDKGPLGMPAWALPVAAGTIGVVFYAMKG